MNKTIVLILENGETLEVKPIPFGKLPHFTETFANLLNRLADISINLESSEDFKRLFDVAFEEVIALMGKIIDKPREWFDTISISDGLAIMDAILELNWNEKTKKNFSALRRSWSHLLRMRQGISSGSESR